MRIALRCVEQILFYCTEHVGDAGPPSPSSSLAVLCGISLHPWYVVLLSTQVTQHLYTRTKSYITIHILMLT